MRRNAVVKNQRTKQRAQRILGDCWQWESNGQCVKGDNCSFRHDMKKRGKVAPSNPSPNSFMQQNERKASRTRSPRGRSPSGRMSRWPCKDHLKGTCNNSFCERWHPPECLFCKTKSGCRFGEKCSFAHRQVDEQPTKRSKKNNDKSAVTMLKKGDWHGRGPVTDQGQDRSGQPHKRDDKKLERRFFQRRFSDVRQLGCAHETAGLGTLSSKFKKNSSQNTFVQKHFHPKQKTISSNDTFIQKWFHPMTLSSKNGFVQ